jgi:sortase A
VARRRLRQFAVVLLAAAGLWQLGSAGLVEAKAWLAPLLIERAWERGLAEGRPQQPWPWADHRPAARLTVPRLGLDRLVLDDGSARSLAFGPGLVAGRLSAAGVGPQAAVVAGHRDTHFRFLRELRPGDRLDLETRAGRRAYRVTETRVLDRPQLSLPAAGDRPLLILTTCYPFDTLIPGGPQRYLVIAEAEEAAVAAAVEIAR